MWAIICENYLTSKSQGNKQNMHDNLSLTSVQNIFRNKHHFCWIIIIVINIFQATSMSHYFHFSTAAPHWTVFDISRCQNPTIHHHHHDSSPSPSSSSSSSSWSSKVCSSLKRPPLPPNRPSRRIRPTRKNRDFFVLFFSHKIFGTIRITYDFTVQTAEPHDFFAHFYKFLWGNKLPKFTL